jgi:hypothetical protein
MPGLGIDRHIANAIPEAVDLEVEAVQMHGVRLRAQVEHSPVDRFAELIRQPLGGRPRQAVDHEGHTWLELGERGPGVVGGQHRS